MNNVQPNTILGGTAIVAIRTPAEVIVGADSMLSAVGNAHNTTSVCKIIEINGMFIACARLMGETCGRFSMAKTATLARQRGGTILETVALFESLIVPPLTAALADLRRDHGGYYQRAIEGGSAAEAIFFGLENNIPVMYLRYFRATGRPDGSVSIEVHRADCPGNCPDGIAYAVLGKHDASDRVLTEDRNFWKMGLVKAVRRLIEIEIEAHPEEVAPPIDIIQIDRNGPQWIQRKMLGSNTIFI